MTKPTRDEKLEIDVFERSGAHDGEKQRLDERLFMQLQVYTGCRSTGVLVESVKNSGVECALYRDVNDPTGVGILTMSPDPTHFVTTVRDMLNDHPFRDLRHRPELTMFGRSYTIGYEPDLRDWLLEKPRRTALNSAWPWAVWYPLRRTGAFATLPAKEQRKILSEHARIGMAYGQADLAHDIRLACHGVDANDNEFVIGLVGARLHPLSHLVQTMRGTRQTSEYIQSMGPFFVGHALWQSLRA